jgi:metal-responsive CopG/Arc/MetJ family transcriptional regulator
MGKYTKNRFTFYVRDRSLLEELEEVAERERRSISQMVIFAIEEYLANQKRKSLSGKKKGS